MIETIALVSTLLWPLGEVGLIIQRKTYAERTQCFQGGGAGIIWAVALCGTVTALLTRFFQLFPLPFSSTSLAIGAAVFVLSGASLRFYAVWTLGAFFTVDVDVKSDHTLITKGLYRYVRHPGYTGLLLGFTGVGLISESWAGLALAVIPLFVILLYRIRVEEEALGQCFGDKYREYRHRSYRLIPPIF